MNNHIQNSNRCDTFHSRLTSSSNSESRLSQESNTSIRGSSVYDTPVKMSPSQIDWTTFNLNSAVNDQMVVDPAFPRPATTDPKLFRGGKNPVMNSAAESQSLLETLITSHRDHGSLILNNDGRDTTAVQPTKMPHGTRRQFLRTKMCPFLINGKCTNARFCSYAHSMEQLRPLPDLRQTKLCDETKKGLLCSNPYCTYAHAIYELKHPTPDLITYKTTLCFFWRKGKCFNGAKCRFAHGIHELRDTNLGSQFSSFEDQDTRLKPLTEELFRLSQSSTPPPIGPAHQELLESLVPSLLTALAATQQRPLDTTHYQNNLELFSNVTGTVSQPTPMGIQELLQRTVVSEMLLSAALAHRSMHYSGLSLLSPLLLGSPLSGLPTSSSSCSHGLSATASCPSHSRSSEATIKAHSTPELNLLLF